MDDPIRLEEVCEMVGQLYLENWRLQRKVQILLDNAKANQSKPTAITVEPKETVSDAA